MNRTPPSDIEIVKLHDGLWALMKAQARVSTIVDPILPTQDTLKSILLGLTSEVHEVGEELGWQEWEAEKALDRERVAEEFADVLAHLGRLIYYAGTRDILPVDLVEAYRRVSVKNIKKLTKMAETI